MAKIIQKFDENKSVNSLLVGSYPLKNEGETKAFGAFVAKELSLPAVLALYGDLGAGKTTFVQGLAEALGIVEPVQSPTFILLNVYERLVPDHKNFQRGLCPDFSAQQSAEGVGNLHQVVEPEREAGLEKMGQNPKNFCGRVLAHFDLYRLKNGSDFVNLGFCEYFEEPLISAIEWPEKIKDLLPQNTIHIHFEHVNGERIAKIL